MNRGAAAIRIALPALIGLGGLSAACGSSHSGNTSLASYDGSAGDGSPDDATRPTSSDGSASSDSSGG